MRLTLLARISRCAALVVGLLALAATATADPPAAGKNGKYGDPGRFEDSIKAFEKQDATDPPAPGAILFVGSSTIRKWHATVARDMAPLTVVARGFGGSNMHDAVYYAERIILAYHPRAVVLYEGDNDIAQEISPELVAETFQILIKKIHAKLPKTRIYFLAIKPSVRRWSMQPRAARANQQITAICARDPRLTYVDMVTPMLNQQGQVRADLFLKDMLHMNPQGYALWTSILKPLLIQHELVHESKSPQLKSPQRSGNDCP